jgi:diguanylate cyclase (GGDEF)-like protein
METAINPEIRYRSQTRMQYRFVVGLFGILFSMQAFGFAVLGTGRAGQGLSECILVIDVLLALSSVWLALRRANGITALFWLLFGVVVIVLLIPTAIQAHDTVFALVTMSESTRGLIYCLYGAPILMMLFLPETHGRERVRLEIFLDMFQVAIVVSLIYSTFFFLPDRGLRAAEALLHVGNVSDLQSLLLLIAGFVRLQFSRVPGTRALLVRLNIFLLSCAVVTFVGDWVFVRFNAYAPWFDLGWSVPIAVAAFVAVSWTPLPNPIETRAPNSFMGFLGTNLALVAMLSATALLTDRWKQAYGGTLTNVAIGASLLALTLRLALTQFHQHREILQRETMQDQLAVSNLKIAGLLVQAQRQSAEMSQINELGNLLQSCENRKEVFTLIPHRMSHMFPESSGALSVVNSSRTRTEPVAQWGPLPPIERSLTWDLLPSDADSITATLIAHDEVMGVLAVQDNLQPESDPPTYSEEEIEHRRQVASALAEQIALTVSNLDLREALQIQAIRDPLTGLFNRRYMREFLEREIHRANRHRHPLAVLMMDIDHFKRYNDSFGHAAGDAALRLVGETLLKSVRADDMACRYGGEEFVVILAQCPLAQAVIRGEQIRARLRDLYTSRPDELPAVVTVSIGIAAFHETTDEMDLLLRLADDALYQAKHEGRDRVVVARSEIRGSAPPPGSANDSMPTSR